VLKIANTTGRRQVQIESQKKDEKELNEIRIAAARRTKKERRN
jgi:hypothetical protein